MAKKKEKIENQSQDQDKKKETKKTVKDLLNDRSIPYTTRQRIAMEAK